MPIVHMCLVLLTMVVGKDWDKTWKIWKDGNQQVKNDSNNMYTVSNLLVSMRLTLVS